MKRFEKLCSRAVQKAVSHESGTWPPGCGIILYQPERPVQKPCQRTERRRQIT